MTAFFSNEYWLFITQVIGGVVFVIFFVQVLYLFFFSLSGLFYKEQVSTVTKQKNRFVIYIPAYKEDAVILDTASRALLLDYPKELFHIVVIADSLREDTLSALRKMPLQLVEVSFEKSTKAKALNKAIAQTSPAFDYAIVFDADNVAESDYLLRMNDAFNKGYQVVQGQRTAKNQNTPMALLDTMSEAINNHIFRKGHRVVGLSAAIIGSAMGLHFPLFREVMASLTAVGGFDKEMELYLLSRRIAIGYASRAIVYDEKVQRADVLEKQRKRWLSAQFVYLRKHLIKGIMALFMQGKLDYFNKVFQMALIPRVMLLAILPCMYLLSIVPGHAPAPFVWLIVWVMGYMAIIISIPRKRWNKKLFGAMLRLPAGIFAMFRALLGVKGANKSFIHTPHGQPDTNHVKDKL
jgi:cellulose synthase/poly-beta-1,6-N-acetylglucosamine synthase-like glycosyltransferase